MFPTWTVRSSHCILSRIAWQTGTGEDQRAGTKSSDFEIAQPGRPSQACTGWKQTDAQGHSMYDSGPHNFKLGYSRSSACKFFMVMARQNTADSATLLENIHEIRTPEWHDMNDA